MKKSTIIYKNMKKCILPVIALSICFPSYAKRLNYEKHYQQIFCEAYEGIAEVVLWDKTRVDCETSEYAIELDFADKWAECIGQAIYYGKMLDKQPACVLITEDPAKDKKYVERFSRADTNITLFTIGKNGVIVKH
jgi:hypothetical protein